MSVTNLNSVAASLNRTTYVILSGALIMSAALGIRQTFGLFIGPFSLDHGVPVTLIAFAIALHNLVWGVAQPLAGAAADRYGSAPVVAFGAVTFAAGLTLAAVAPSGVTLVVGMGLLVGIGISCTSFGVVMTAVGRGTSADKRSLAMGLASAGGSLGQVLLVPLAQMTTAASGMSVSLLVLAALMLLVTPLGIILDRRGSAPPPAPERPASTLTQVLLEAAHHRGYRLLTVGFFACGFQLAFIATHLPGYLSLCHMPIGLGATALALIGLFNMAGSWACGWLGGRFRQQYVLGWLYLIRSINIATFFLLPKTNTSVVIFAAVMGMVWLGSVPLTSGFLARIFGTRHLGTLFGVCFLSHQIGSFLGSWLGGFVFDVTGSYSLIWGATTVAGLLAATLHFLITDTATNPPIRPELLPALAK